MSAAGCQTVLPSDVGSKIPKDDFVCKPIEICGGLDYINLYRKYIGNWRKVDSVILFKLPVSGYMNGIDFGRGIEKACRQDIRFIWIFPVRVKRNLIQKHLYRRCKNRGDSEPLHFRLSESGKKEYGKTERENSKGTPRNCRSTVWQRKLPLKR